MEETGTAPLFDLKHRKLTWKLAGELLHFDDGLMVTHLTRTMITPFQVITYHVDEIPIKWLTDHGQYETFRAAMTMLGAAAVTKDALRPAGRAHRKTGAAQASKAPGALNYPSWWVES